MFVNNSFSHHYVFNSSLLLDVCSRSNRTEILTIKYKFWTYILNLDVFNVL